MDKIELLWANYEANHLEILHAERELGKIHDNELRDKLQDLKFFEILQAEKANAHFLDIAKKASCTEKFTDICDSDGKILLSSDELGKYITNFYSSLFRLDETVQGEIEDFNSARERRLR